MKDRDEKKINREDREIERWGLGSSDFWLFLDFDYTSYRFEKLNKI
jgi:hypothetical protein